MTTTVPTKPRLANADRSLAIVLLAEFRSRLAQSHADHDAGWHVGRDGDDVCCGACNCSGDMPGKPTMTRAEYLERNIEHAIAEMRMHADLVAFERAGALES